MWYKLLGLLAVVVVGVGVWSKTTVAPTVAEPVHDAAAQEDSEDTHTPAQQTSAAPPQVAVPATQTSTQAPSAAVLVLSGKNALTNAQLLAMAGDDFANGIVPLGDNKYVTSGPKKGYVYLCNARSDGQGGAGTDGPWIVGSSWNYIKKMSVKGSVSWPNATFTNSVASTIRTLAGNALPINHTTGTYPVQSSDPAYQYDRNPNGISAQSLRVQVPSNPQYSDTPYCMGGEAGIMLTGVPLFNAFDAGLRDAPAHELQDSCDGHPQNTGEYHYHSMSDCFKDIGVTTVLGFAYDGFPITGPKVAEGEYLTTADLDECHGITSTVLLDGKEATTYHYVMTRDFPYSVSCFRGKPTTTAPSGGGMQPPGGMPPPRF
jgi:hypothetical protein